MSELFSVIYQTEHGDTVASDNPKLDAYKQAYYLTGLGYVKEIIKNDDESYTVKGYGIASITFEKGE